MRNITSDQGEGIASVSKRIRAVQRKSDIGESHKRYLLAQEYIKSLSTPENKTFSIRISKSEGVAIRHVQLMERFGRGITKSDRSNNLQEGFLDEFGRIRGIGI